jgi:hypothetical protein
MAIFLLYTFLVICIGIFVRIFWLPLLIVGAILVILAGITVSAAVTALVFTMLHAMFTQGEWTGFSTYFTYSFVFFVAATLVYGAIVSDIYDYGVIFMRRIFRKY